MLDDAIIAVGIMGFCSMFPTENTRGQVLLLYVPN